MKKRILAILIVALIFTSMVFTSTVFAENKILYVDSYHEGYAWSDGITKGIQSVLEGKGVELKIFRMDSKRNAHQPFIMKAAEEAKGIIENWKPDVVITSDDNASRYLIKPFFKNTDIPFVFCGLNWDASMYGFPCKNVTGMIEVSPVPNLLKYLQPFAKGNKIAYLAADILTARKEGHFYKTLFQLEVQALYAKNYEQWSKGYEHLQKTCDILIVDNTAGINDWDEASALRTVVDKTRIPTGSLYDFMAVYAFISYTKIAGEQGEWAAETALNILKGADVRKIPVAKNKKGKLIVNKKIAKALQIDVPETLLQAADEVIE